MGTAGTTSATATLRHPSLGRDDSSAMSPGSRPPGGGGPEAGPAPLSHQDLEILRLLADGALTGAVARKLRTSERTVRRRIRNICDQLGVTTPVQAIVWAAHRGLL